MEWTNDAVIRLVKGYQKRPELWDNSHDMYRVYTAKHEAWEELAAMFDCDVIDTKKKIASLLASHRREKARVRTGARSKWFLYRHLTFLPTHVNENNVAAGNANDSEADNNEDDHQEAEYLDMPEDDLHEEVIIKQEPHPKKTVIYTDGSSIRKATPRSHHMKSLKRRQVPHSASPATGTSITSNANVDSTMVEIVKSLRNLKKKDECDSFGEYIANSLRKHDERTRSMIKHAINNILFEQEMKKYSAGHYDITVGHDDDENPLTLGSNMDDDN